MRAGRKEGTRERGKVAAADSAHCRRRFFCYQNPLPIGGLVLECCELGSNFVHLRVDGWFRIAP